MLLDREIVMYSSIYEDFWLNELALCFPLPFVLTFVLLNKMFYDSDDVTGLHYAALS